MRVLGIESPSQRTSFSNKRRLRRSHFSAWQNKHKIGSVRSKELLLRGPHGAGREIFAGGLTSSSESASSTSISTSPNTSKKQETESTCKRSNAVDRTCAYILIRCHARFNRNGDAEKVVPKTPFLVNFGHSDSLAFCESVFSSIIPSH